MKIHIIAYPHGVTRRTLTVELIYKKDTRSNCPFFSEDGTIHIPPSPVQDIPLDSGFTFSGHIFGDIVIESEKGEMTIQMNDIVISRDGVQHFDLTKSSVAEILVSNKPR